MIPVCEPLLSERETELVLDCLRSGWISSTGDYLKKFERGWATYCGMQHGIAVCNGTAALLIAARLLELKPGDEVIMPAFTIISCAQAITECGGVPVLVDSDPVNWQMDISQIRRKITPKTRAIMVAHIYGHPADMNPIMDLADKFGLKVIEDAAEAHGAEYRSHKCGGLGDVSVFSFYANKLITTGEGGMVLTRTDDLAQKARSLRNLCFKQSRRFSHDTLGYNFRMTNMQAALGVAQLERIEQIIDRKRAIAQAYTERLREVDGIALPVEEKWAKNIYWVYGIVLDKSTGINAARFGECLSQKRIGTRPFFLGMHEQPIFQKMGLFMADQFPVAERLSRQGLYLPTGLPIKASEIDRVCDAVKACLQTEGRKNGAE